MSDEPMLKTAIILGSTRPGRVGSTVGKWKKTGRRRLVFGGLHTEICLTFAVV